MRYYYRNYYGCFTSPKMGNVVIYAIIASFMAYCALCVIQSLVLDQPRYVSPTKALETPKDACVKQANGEYQCSTKADLEAAKGVTKWYVEGVAKVEIKNTPMTILRKVCDSQGIKGADCPVILAAMARQESIFGKAMTGDSGKSRGWFHINSTWHKVPLSCSMDLSCSASWTLKRMIGKGYSQDKEYAIMSHNGTPNTKATLAYLTSVKHWMKEFVPTLK